MADEKSQQDILSSILDVTKCANLLPKLGAGFELYNSYPMFADLLKIEASRLKDIMNSILKQANTKTSINPAYGKDELFEILERANDFLSERIANYMDEAEGKRKPEELVVVSSSNKLENSANATQENVSAYKLISASWNKLPVPVPKGKNIAFAASTEGVKSLDEELKLLGGKNVARPQIEFQHLIDNSRRPFFAKLKVKHNASRLDAQKPQLTLKCDDDEEYRSKIETVESDLAEHSHPYKYELDHLVPDEEFLQKVEDLLIPDDPKMYKLTMVSTSEELKNLCESLNMEKEFAVDLEHHSYRTFQGLTCLMQISTRTQNFLIDTLKLWKEMSILNEPFSNPKILKVFHGAQHDIEWLQRDFGIYVVNMFDTGQAMRLLGMARFSLAHLVKTFLSKDLNKQFQLADWRIRPLPQVLIDYAVEDTHYLLYCFDRLKNELIDSGNERKNLLVSVFERSRDLCVRHYEKPLFDESDYLKLCAQSKKTFNARQKMALKELYAWRDNLARLSDESISYVLPDHMMLQIAQVLPREMQGILSCCNPVPPLVKQELSELHKIVHNARMMPETDLSKNKPMEQTLDFGRRSAPLKPHDFSHSAEDEEMVSSLLANLKEDLSLLKSVSKMFRNDQKINVKNPKKFPVFVTPFEMYAEAEKQRCQKEIEERKKNQTASTSNLPENELNKLQATTPSAPSEEKILLRKSLKRPNEEENIEEEMVENNQENLQKIPVAKNEKEKASKRNKKRKKLLDDQPLPSFNYEEARHEMEAQNSASQHQKRDFYDPARDYLAQKRPRGGGNKRFGKKASKSSTGR